MRGSRRVGGFHKSVDWLKADKAVELGSTINPHPMLPYGTPPHVGLAGLTAEHEYDPWV